MIKGIYADVSELIQQVAPTPVNVVLVSGTSTDREFIARAVHKLSPRAKLPFVAVHCTVQSPTLLESELFGHEKGAFTGAHERRIGRFELARGGTLFLDEIGEIDATVQVKLLRPLVDRTFKRMGSNQILSADVRLVTGAKKKLGELVKDGKFREDLLYRLSVIEIELLPLCGRGVSLN